MREISIAKRMSWASKRVTTRTEDIAYCLVGIFGVNLPLLYGEGERAFVRLQEEIMKSSDDQSLFAWGLTMEEFERDFPSGDDPLTNTGPSTLRGFLARSPAAFANSGKVIPYRNWDVSMPYSMTNQGLRMELPVIQYEGCKEYTGILACHFEDNFLGPLGIYIQPVASPNGDQFARDVSHLNPVIVVPQHVALAQVRTIYIRQEVLLPTTRDFDRRNHFLIRTMPDQQPYQEYTLHEVHPAQYWHESQKIIRAPEGSDRTAVLLFKLGPKGSTDVQPEFAVIVRSSILPGGTDGDAYSCSCGIVVKPPIKPEDGSVFDTLDTYIKETHEHTYARQDLNPNDRTNTERESAIVSIGREIFMGQAMFVVDIGVTSTRYKRVPFFAQS
ncbi:hypothetical protein ONS96_014008 [Cadophora gregata f. sp. sojae]|nr:hypothetical protein ONS96_014008 [Cadophora gregata f. sp. sojae]